ncbi:glycoside hydrolase family 2 protein [Chthonobacter albigriseus]|uniref:glycoside hydrolase family 2 protein n=1 Tax=Chthonobacter albigriseus TaxID=1683161 RepID=UPI0015EF4F85|nr:glycoside hydrolase family 2 protein [Chthonobacter albigriseus]
MSAATDTAPDVARHEGWRLLSTRSGAFPTPDALPPDAEFTPAEVPGTVAGALERAGRFDRQAPIPLHDDDHWFLGDLVGRGRTRLVFEGLATICDVFVDDRHLLRTSNMFARDHVEVELDGRHRIALCFRALSPALAMKGPRARWRPQMIPTQGLRLVRTTLLGHMPGWCPSVHAVGPYREIRLEDPSTPFFESKRVDAAWDGGKGRLTVRVEASNLPGGAAIVCAGRSAPLVGDGAGGHIASLDGLDVEPWWPATHGDQPLYPVTLAGAGREIELCRTGFRTIGVTHGSDGRGFGLNVNGEPIFCRGAVWTNADIVDLPADGPRLSERLSLVREAGMNMVRIGGTMTYESPAFFRLCDELGILVWQDLMFANFDYPASDAAFVAEVRREVRDQLSASAGSPSLAVVCGGSEVMQQAAMFGLPRDVWRHPLFTEILPPELEALRPDVPYVENSPSGGPLPFVPGEGIGHYYGVGAYGRPLEDARRAEVRFAGECLAFSNVPDEATLARSPLGPAVHHPRWKAGVPRDLAASWDFEDVRETYLAMLYGIDPQRLRREDPVRYLELSRAVTGDVMEATFGEWRRGASPTRGALVWTLTDLAPGAGWGVVDHSGCPKPAWHALKRAFRPLSVWFTDEGTNGLAIHLANERPAAVKARLKVEALRNGRTKVVGFEREVDLPPRSLQAFDAAGLLGAFFDFTYAYRFGPPSHDVVTASLVCAETGDMLADAHHLPLGRRVERQPILLTASCETHEDGFVLSIATDRFARGVHVVDECFRAVDDWFHLSPGVTRRMRLVRRPDAAASAEPHGEIRALNACDGVSYQV